MLGCQSPDKRKIIKSGLGLGVHFWLETLSLTLITPQRYKDVAKNNWDYVSTSTTSRNNRVCLHLKVFSRVPKLASSAQYQVVEILTKRRTMRRIHQMAPPLLQSLLQTWERQEQQEQWGGEEERSSSCCLTMTWSGWQSLTFNNCGYEAGLLWFYAS